MTRCVALMRAIANVPMSPFREALEGLGLANVSSFGMSGNLLFDAPTASAAHLERRIGDRLGAIILVRTARQMATIARADPFVGRRDATVLFLRRPPTPTQRAEFRALDIAEPRPVLRGTALHFAGWPLVAGKRFDLEKALGTGTLRSSKVVARLAALLAAP